LTGRRAPFTGNRVPPTPAARSLSVKERSMSTKLALQLNAVVGIGSAIAATAIMSLALTRPEALASAIAQREYGDVALAVLSQVAGWIHALLRFV
jgi:precorrin-4 methylase